MSRPPRPKIILDTDLGGDIDDLGAVALLHELADRGDCEILGFVSDTLQRHAVSCIDAVGRYFGRVLPVARPAGILEVQGTYADAVYAANPDALDGEDAPEAVASLKTWLEDAPDQSVVIATIGQLWHQRDLVEQHADLVKAKVCRYVVMGGHTPLSPTDPSADLPETNFRAADRPGVTAAFLSACPVPIVFCGSEAGNRENGYGTGTAINRLPEDHPVRIGYRDFFARPPWWAPEIGSDRVGPWSIWDQITVLHAVSGPASEARPLEGSGFAEVHGRTNHADETGMNNWEPAQTNDPDHAYLAPMAAPRDIADRLIEPLMVARIERA